MIVNVSVITSAPAAAFTFTPAATAHSITTVTTAIATVIATVIIIASRIHIP